MMFFNTNSNFKISYSFEELNLFANLNCQEPKVYSDIDYCLKILKDKRNEFHKQLLDKETQQDCIDRNPTKLINLASNEIILDDYKKLPQILEVDSYMFEKDNVESIPYLSCSNNSSNHDLFNANIFSADLETASDNFLNKCKVDNKNILSSNKIDVHNIHYNDKTGLKPSANVCLNRQYSDDGYSGSQLSPISNIDQNPFFIEADNTSNKNS